MDFLDAFVFSLFASVGTVSKWFWWAAAPREHAKKLWQQFKSIWWHLLSPGFTSSWRRKRSRAGWWWCDSLLPSPVTALNPITVSKGTGIKTWHTWKFRASLYLFHYFWDGCKVCAVMCTWGLAKWVRIKYRFQICNVGFCPWRKEFLHGCYTFIGLKCSGNS